MASHLQNVGSTNIGGEYDTASAALDVVAKARQAGKDIVGAEPSDEIAFGLNCTNLMFHLARSIENFSKQTKFNETDGITIEAGDNIILSRACHDANIAPWLLLARNLQLEVRWLDCIGSYKFNENEVTDSNMDCIDVARIPSLIDDKTRLISLGIASNVTGRIHLNVIENINEVVKQLPPNRKPYCILDGTHYVPHRRCDMGRLHADAIVCSAYKFCGPHVGVMAFNGARFKHLLPSKVGIRFNNEEDVHTDILDAGISPSTENFQISRWEMGTLNYEGLAGFEACVDYLSGLSNGYKEGIGGKEIVRTQQLDKSFDMIQNHEEALSERFLKGIDGHLKENRIRLLGSRDVKNRTPTFAMTTNNSISRAKHTKNNELDFVKFLNAHHILCTHGNHYAPDLVENCLQEPSGVTRISLLHYNTYEEVDKIVCMINRYLE